MLTNHIRGKSLAIDFAVIAASKFVSQRIFVKHLQNNLLAAENRTDLRLRHIVYSSVFDDNSKSWLEARVLNGFSQRCHSPRWLVSENHQHPHDELRTIENTKRHHEQLVSFSRGVFERQTTTQRSLLTCLDSTTFVLSSSFTLFLETI